MAAIQAGLHSLSERHLNYFTLLQLQRYHLKGHIECISFQKFNVYLIFPLGFDTTNVDHFYQPNQRKKSDNLYCVLRLNC